MEINPLPSSALSGVMCSIKKVSKNLTNFTIIRNLKPLVSDHDVQQTSLLGMGVQSSCKFLVRGLCNQFKLLSSANLERAMGSFTQSLELLFLKKSKPFFALEELFFFFNLLFPLQPGRS